jgi:hypothetical protein
MGQAGLNSRREANHESASSQIWFDIVAFEAGMALPLAASPGRLEPSLVSSLTTALGQYRGDLMLGWYDDWVLIERERLRLLCLRGYRRLMEHYSAVGDLENALAAGLSALRIEPLQELVQQHVILHDQVVLAVDLHLGAGPLAEQHAVTGLDVDRDQLALLIPAARTRGDDLALLRLLLCGIGNDDASGGLLLGIDAAHEHAVVQWTEMHAHPPCQVSDV